MQRSCRQFGNQHVSASSWLPAVSLVAGLTFWAGLQEAHAAEPKPEPFKFMNIHFETNASGCDMGIQILFDTDGVTELSIEGPNDVIVFSSWTPAGKEDTHDQTEGFQERVEPPISELENALGCDSSPDAISLGKLFEAWPAGTYEFEATSGGVDFEGETRLTHKIPAGPEITAPEDGAVVPHDQPLVIRWNKVTGPILPNLGPVEIVGYHVVVKDVTDRNCRDHCSRLRSTLMSRRTKRASSCRSSTSSRTEFTSSRSCRPRRVPTRPSRRVGFSVRFRELLQIANCRNWRNARNQSAQRPARPSANADASRYHMHCSASAN